MENNISAVTTKKQRYVFIDVLRGLAVLWMIETHVLDATLYNPFKQGLIYYLFDLSNGFVAVSFLFFAGSGFWIAATRKAESYRKFEAPLWQYLKRLGLILILAYWLHLPAMSFRTFPSLNLQSWLRFFECDVLQTIVYSSLFALILLMLFKNLNILKYVYGFLALAIFLIAPFVWNIEPINHLPVFFATLFSKYPISKFPLLPWSGYFFSGIFISGIFFQAKNKIKVATILSIFGTITLILLYINWSSTQFYPGFQDWWHISPFHSLFRTSFVVAMFGIFFLLEEKYKNTRLGQALTLCGQESLFIYIFHLLIVYGSIVNHGLNYYIGNHLSPFEVALLIIAIWIVSYSSALSWNYLKNSNPKFSKLVIYSYFLLFFIIMLVRPF
jgi:uncharacterized membrane protein